MGNKVLEGVKHLQQFMDDGSMLLPDMPVVFRLLQSMHAPEFMDYDYVLSISGAAVRLSWQPGWAAYNGEPNQSELFINGDRLIEFHNVFHRIGLDYETYFIESKRDFWKDNYSGDITWTSVEQAKIHIIQSIDQGIPVIIKGPYAASLIVGYENDGAQLIGVAVFSSPEERYAPNNYTKITDWESQMKGYFIVKNFNPRSMDKDLLCDVLRTAVSLARTNKIPMLGDTALGISTFDRIAELMVWDENFEPLNVDEKFEGSLSWPYDMPKHYYREDGARKLSSRFWAGYCDFLCMLNGYSNFSRFLFKYAELVPEWSEQLKKAAEYYNTACNYSGELWNYVTPDKNGLEKFKTKEVRYAFAAHMLRAKIYTVRAVMILEKLIERVE